MLACKYFHCREIKKEKKTEQNNVTAILQRLYINQCPSSNLKGDFEGGLNPSYFFTQSTLFLPFGILSLPYSLWKFSINSHKTIIWSTCCFIVEQVKLIRHTFGQRKKSKNYWLAIFSRYLPYSKFWRHETPSKDMMDP